MIDYLFYRKTIQQYNELPPIFNQHPSFLSLLSYFTDKPPCFIFNNLTSQSQFFLISEDQEGSFFQAFRAHAPSDSGEVTSLSPVTSFLIIFNDEPDKLRHTLVRFIFKLRHTLARFIFEINIQLIL